MKNEERYSIEVLKKAIELQIKKGGDYNADTSRVQQADYYQQGIWSLMDNINGKYLRMVSVLEKMEAGGDENFESVQDSCIDLINYASFAAAWLEGKVPGQDSNKDIFNNPVKDKLSFVPCYDCVNNDCITYKSCKRTNHPAAGLEFLQELTESQSPVQISAKEMLERFGIEVTDES